MRHLNIKIFGRVQGIGFRYSAKLKAEEIGITGFVRNEEDGSVYIEIEGDEKMSEGFMNWCKNFKGAEIEDIDIQEGEVKNFPAFVIK